MNDKFDVILGCHWCRALNVTFYIHRVSYTYSLSIVAVCFALALTCTPVRYSGSGAQDC